jgi:alpha-beta hydrolase superfamily lysophospholipase
MEQRITFTSAGTTLAGVIHTPAGAKAGERRPAVVICHGFGGHKDGPQQLWTATKLAEWGYVALRFDFRGCGESGGRRGWVIAQEQVDDVKEAVSYMQSRGDVDPQGIAVSGTSFGAAVAIYAAGVDPRIAAVMSQGGWADGTSIAQTQHPTPEKWQAYIDRVETARRKSAETGKTQYLHRYDIVPVPERLRAFIDERSIFEFPVETALTKFYFRPGDVIGNIAPRPVLLLHAANDSVTGAKGSLELFARSKPPTELHLLTDVDHFMYGEEDSRIDNLVHDWLKKYFPAP